ncbi:nucleolar complex protein 14, partial [Serendipita sp. 399]
VDHRDKRAEKLRELHEKFNPFDVKVEKLKHDVGGRKIKGTLGRPGLSKQAGIEQRKKTLLVEYEKKDKVGGVLDRRFGEDDPTMSLEERMLARFTKERQRSSKAAMFNLEDDTELTHFGQSLSKLDDFDNVGLNLSDDADEDDAGQINAATVKATHFKGFSDDEDNEEEDGPPRKRTKAEVMTEVIAKSKEHKYARQLQREQDENTRHELDEDFDAIRGILFPKSSPPAAPPLPPSRSTIASESINKPNKAPTDKDYDSFVRELAMDKRAQPKDRTKTEEELALEEKEALELAEKRRLKRMMGEPEESEDEDGKSRKRRRGGDDLDDDFLLDDDIIGGLGTGLNATGVDGEMDEDVPEQSEGEDEEGEEVDTDGDEDEDATLDGNSEEGEDRFGDSDEGEEAEAGSVEELVPHKVPKTSARIKVKGELPFTFSCPSNHDELLEILDGVDDSQIGLVVERIRKLHHPSLHPDNKYKLQAFIGVILDHIIYSASIHPPSLQTIEVLNSHLYSISKAYPIQAAEHFVSKLNILQKNLVRGLQDPLASSSKTFPGPAELVFLRVLGATWSTSDLKHVVVSPARYLMGAYLGLGRIRSLKDVASGLYLCSIFMQYEDLSKRLIPEAVNFVVQTLLLLSPSSYTTAKSIPGPFPVPDIDILDSKLHFKLKKAEGVTP